MGQAMKTEARSWLESAKSALSKVYVTKWKGFKVRGGREGDETSIRFDFAARRNGRRNVRLRGCSRRGEGGVCAPL